MESMRLAQSPERRLGILFAVLSGVGFGFLGILGKYSYQAGMTAGEHLALRFLLAAALLWTYLLVFRRGALRVPVRSLLTCIALGAVGYAIFSTMYFSALAHLSASLTVMLLYTYPALVALGGWALFRLRPARRQLISLPIVMGGLVLLISGDLTVGASRGIYFGLASAALYALYLLISNRALSGINPLVSVCYIQSAAGLALAALHLRDPDRVLALVTSSWPVILGSALLCTVVPMVLIFAALQRLQPAHVSLLSTAEPITGVVAASLLLGERLAPMQIAGATIIIAALIYMSRPERAALPATA